MSKDLTYYREVKIIKYCKTCGTMLRPRRGSVGDLLGLCYTCRGPYQIKAWRDWYAALSPEAQKKCRAAQYIIWKAWCKKNISRRRAQALASYHRKKHLHKARKHRATKIKTT